MVKVAAALAEAGQTEQAFEAASRIENRWARSKAMMTVLEAAADTGSSVEANVIASKVLAPGTWFDDESSALRAALALSKISGSPVALRAVIQYSPDRQSRVLVRAVEALSKTTKVDDLLDTVRKISAEPQRTTALVKIAEILASAGDRTRGRGVLEEAQLAARQIPRDADRSIAIAEVAKGFARLHFYRQAREAILQDTFSAEKVAVHTAIVREYRIARSESGKTV